MVPIVLCDDDPFTLQLLSELLERAIRQSKAEANLSVWPLLVRSRSSLSAAVEAISIFSIMTWEGIPPNGVDLVRQIYHTDPGRENRLCYRPWGEGHGYSAQPRAALWVY